VAHYGEMSPAPDATGLVALVTGANKGIGAAVARGLGALNYTVLVGARDPERGAAGVRALVADGVDARLCVLDVCDQPSIDAAAAAIEREHGRLDVLVNNAAVKLEFHPAAPSRTPIHVVRSTYETNVFGTMRVIQAMLPLLLSSPAPRIVNLSSGLGSLTLATTAGSAYMARPLLGYNTAKAALNSVTVQFANEFRDTPLKVNAADPGYVRTDMTRNDGSRTPEQGAAVVLRLATLPADGPTGAFFDERGPVPW
jgi:NAD(P)-dependent dehydrogenase (short-subunit alcohol dehydrogenase family)